MFTAAKLAAIGNSKAQLPRPSAVIARAVVDHRDRIDYQTVFVAIKGLRADGHDFVSAAFEAGAAAALVDEDYQGQHPENNVIKVKSTLRTLQMWARENRQRCQSATVVGITGSNGKTIVKEWLAALLGQLGPCCSTPKSYNSQIGVPLSVLALGAEHRFGVFEAGISRVGEMEHLASIIAPSVGVFTNLGDAHSAFFTDDSQKLSEKWKLFEQCKTVVFRAGQPWQALVPPVAGGQQYVRWSFGDAEAEIVINRMTIGATTQLAHKSATGSSWQIEIAHTDDASVENATHCAVVLHHLGLLSAPIQKAFASLPQVSMRTEVKRGIENTLIIDDSYNSDLQSFFAAINHLNQYAQREKLVVISEVREQANPAEAYRAMAAKMRGLSQMHVIAIGRELKDHAWLFEDLSMEYFESVQDLLSHWKPSQFANRVVLVKGARAFGMERLVNALQQQHHPTRLEVDLAKLDLNLAAFRRALKPDTKIMVMVKAFGYGSGGAELAAHLSGQGVNYLAVAYADEGAELRRQGINTPIMVMNPLPTAAGFLIAHRLEPEVYSMAMLQAMHAAAIADNLNHVMIHLKIDTGMHRLGFEPDAIPAMVAELNRLPRLRVASVFSHLSASGSANSDEFTIRQAQVFQRALITISDGIGYKPLAHLLNSDGVARFPQFQHDMVRLGIGLYGFAEGAEAWHLQALGNFVSYVLQVRTVAAGEWVGYGPSGIAEHDRRIATVAVGYADGLDRRLGNGRWALKWRGHPCPIVGNVCMDMCMVDVGDKPVSVGDEMTVMSGVKEVNQMAALLGTIPYEVLTKISQRVPRVFSHE